jgi:hypothetical protein
MRTALAALAFLAASCGGDSKSGDSAESTGSSGTPTSPTTTATATTAPTTAPTTPPSGTTTVVVQGDVTDLTAVHEAIPTVIDVNWKTDIEGTSFVRYGLDDALDLVTPTTDADSLEHQRTMLGLKSGRTYSFQAVTVTADGEEIASGQSSIDIPYEPADMVRLNLISHDDTQTAGGFVLTASILADTVWVVILDRDGDYVWYHQPEGDLGILTSRPGRDGNSILFGYYDRFLMEDIGGVYRVPIDGSAPIQTRAILAHHDFRERADGSLVWISMEMRDMLVPPAPDVWSVAGDTIVEAPEGLAGKELGTEIYNWFDDYGHEPWVTSEMMVSESFGLGIHEWTHSNSLMFRDDDPDHYYLMSRYMDALIKIDRTTGDVVWQMGGEHNEFDRIGDPRWWSHAHMSNLWDGGMVVFDNQTFGTRKSRIVEYAIDEETKTIEQVFEYVDPQGRHCAMLGDVRKLPNGNYLVSWSPYAHLSEITPAGEEVWRVQGDLGGTTGRVTWIEDIYDLAAAAGGS